MASFESPYRGERCSVTDEIVSLRFATEEADHGSLRLRHDEREESPCRRAGSRSSLEREFTAEAGRRYPDGTYRPRFWPALIPFLEHDDANRADEHVQRQAVPAPAC